MAQDRIDNERCREVGCLTHVQVEVDRPRKSHAGEQRDHKTNSN